VGAIATMSLKLQHNEELHSSFLFQLQIQLTKLLREASTNTVVKHSFRVYGRPQECIMT